MNGVTGDDLQMSLEGFDGLRRSITSTTECSASMMLAM
jgi:hypothetical protein